MAETLCRSPPETSTAGALTLGCSDTLRMPPNVQRAAKHAFLSASRRPCAGDFETQSAAGRRPSSLRGDRDVMSRCARDFASGEGRLCARMPVTVDFRQRPRAKDLLRNSFACLEIRITTR